MATVQVDDALWAEFCALAEQFKMPGPADFLTWCLRRIIKFEQVADGRYVPVSCAIVTRHEAEILLVGNDYATGQPLFWAWFIVDQKHLYNRIAEGDNLL